MPRPPPPATALIITGITDAFGDGERVLFVFHDAFGAGRDRHAGFFGERAADGLVFQARSWRADWGR